MKINMIEVWECNVVPQFDAISKIATSLYADYIFLDTEFPGFLHSTPVGASPDIRYQDVKRNVDAMKIIQLGFTFFNRHGQPPGFSWQVNFKEFDPNVDLRVESSIKLLKDSGIDFERIQRDGVDSTIFSRLLLEKLILPCRNRARWVMFHGLYDLAYIVKLVTRLPLPNTLPEFLTQAGRLLGDIYDLKHIARCCGFQDNLGLVKIATKLGINTEGPHHQAGYDSELIGEVFWKIKEKFGVREDGFVGVIYGAELRNYAPLRRMTPYFGSNCYCYYPKPPHGFFHVPPPYHDGPRFC